MPQAIFAAIGFLCGAILHGSVLRLVARRRERRLHEALLAGLALALLIWNGASFVRALAEVLNLPPGQLGPLDRALDVVAVPALALVPSLILHTLAAMRARDGSPSRRWLLVYAPLPALGLAVLLEPGAGAALLGSWLVASLLGGAALAEDLARATARRPEALPATPRLYRFLAGTLLATAALAATVVFAAGRRSITGNLLVEVLVIAGSTLPSFALVYGVYRYYAIRPLVRRGAVELAIALAALAVYLLVISTIARLANERWGWNFRAVEGMGIAGLVFLFHPFRRRVLRALEWSFDPLWTKEVTVLRALAGELARPGASQPSELAARVATEVRRALSLERAALAIAPRAGRLGVPAAPPGWIDYRALLAALADAPAMLVEPAAVPDAGLARALEAARVERVRPLRFEGDLVGVLVLGRRADSTRLDDEELRAVESIVGPLSAAITSVRLVDEKIALERRLLDEQRLAGLGRLSATVAHRVKNPLAAIKAIAQAMREDLAESDPRRQDLAIVVEEVDTLTRVVSQLLGFARGAPGGDAGPVDARALAEETLVLLQHQAGAAGVALHLRAGAGVEPVLAEPSALREVLANLVENAIVHSPRGGDVLVEVERAGAAAVRVRVTDSGAGVAPDVRPRLFEPFFTTRPGGTGLGLAVSRQRIEAWGGRIQLETGSEDGAGGERPTGARFAFELPVAPEQAEAGETTEPPRRQDPPGDAKG